MGTAKIQWFKTYFYQVYKMVYFVWENRHFHTHIAILGWSPVGSLDRWMVMATSDDSDDNMLSP